MSDLSDDRFAIEDFQWLDPFIPHRWWRGGWLQTLSIKAIRTELSLSEHQGVVEFEVPSDQAPPDILSGYFLPCHSAVRCDGQNDVSVETDSDSSNARPTIVLLHGMGGHATSGYMLSMASRLLSANYNVILWNNRGAGCSGSKCCRFHHPGYTDDIRLLTEYLSKHRADWCDGGLGAVAFSLGANVLLKYLGEAGEQSMFRAATSISAPLDMETTSKNLRRGLNRIFDRYLLAQQQSELLRENARMSKEERELIENARSVWELDDSFTGPRFGFSGASEFYAAHSAIDYLDAIRTPTLLFHAQDDPVVDVETFTDRDWIKTGPLYPALATSGGHTGFFESDGSRWHERASVRFLDAMF